MKGDEAGRFCSLGEVTGYVGLAQCRESSADIKKNKNKDLSILFIIFVKNRELNKKVYINLK